LTLRTRVAAAAAAAIALALVLLVIVVPKLFARELRGSLDDTLQARAADVARLNASAPAELTQPGALEGRLTGGALYVQVIDRDGRLVVRSSALGGRVLPERDVVERALRDRQPGFADASLGAEPVRLYAAPLGSLSGGPGAGGAVIVAGSTADVDHTVDRARTLIALCALAAAALAALMATLLVRGALRPLTRLSSGARAIERSGDASERLPTPASHDEVGQLAETLNAMLAPIPPCSPTSRPMRRGSACCSTTCSPSPARTPPRRCTRSPSTSWSWPAMPAPTRSWSYSRVRSRANARRSPGPSATSSPTRARTARGASPSPSTAPPSASPTRARVRAIPSARSSASGARGNPVRASGWRSSRRSPSATAEP
jgi:HAMP domain-containing protein